MESWKRAVDYSFASMILVVVSIHIVPFIPGNHKLNLALMFIFLTISFLFAALGVRILTRDGRMKE